ncbi:MAG TPA: hypothetical protein VJ841_02415 [Candidatus Saccharimonadales bacterium]|nr:hypothetical protein [Candidatus Saccharimonadales bacterium]
MSEDEGYPLDDKEQKALHAEARKAGEAARLAWAEDNAPIKPGDARGNVGVIALWLLTVDGKVGREKVTFERLYETYYQGKSHGGSSMVQYHPKGSNQAPQFLHTFGAHQVKSVEQLAIQVATGLCSRSNLDEVHETSNAKWGVLMQNVATGSSYADVEFLYVPSRMPFGRKVTRDDMLIAALKALGFQSDLNDAFNDGYPAKNKKGYTETLEKLADDLLKDPDRNARLKKRGQNAERRQKAWDLTMRGLAKIRSKD